MNERVSLRDVMTREFVGVTESDTVQGAVELMGEEDTHAAVVLRGSEPVGLLACSDVFGLLARGDDPAETQVSDVMSEPPVSLSPTDALDDALVAMANGEGGFLLVANADGVVGCVTARELVAASSLAGAPEEPPETARAGDGGGDEYSTQSICEVCGSLTRDLTNFNGQLICADCREV